MLTLTTTQVRLVENLANQNGLSYSLMMQNAGTMAYQYLSSQEDLIGKQCVILAGNGNNAGDGFVLARLMCQANLNVTLIMCMSAPLTPLGIENFELLRGLAITIIDAQDDIARSKISISTADIIVDAVFGIGFRGELPQVARTVIQVANEVDVTHIALDIPSGINADSGECAEIFFRADKTLSFVAYKFAHLHELANERCGVVEILDIGIPSSIVHAVLNHVTQITEELVCAILPKRKPNSHKGDYGKLLNIAGCEFMSGAAMMSTLAAMRIGAGVVRLATTSSVATMVTPHLMEAMTLPLHEGTDGAISINSISKLGKLLQHSNTCLIGCGLSVTSNTKRLVEYVIENAECNLVIDADALNCCVGHADWFKSMKMTPIITPHMGEMARLVDMSVQDVLDNSVDVAKIFAKEYRVIVVLKSDKTIIATPTGAVFENCSGNAGLAKGGSGDVLAGMIAGLLTQGLSPCDAAICGVYLLGATADSLADKISLYSMLARDVLEELPYVLKRLKQ